MVFQFSTPATAAGPGGVLVLVPSTPHRQQGQPHDQTAKQAECDDFVGVTSSAARAVEEGSRNNVAHRLLLPQSDHNSAGANGEAADTNDQGEHRQCLRR